MGRVRAFGSRGGAGVGEEGSAPGRSRVQGLPPLAALLRGAQISVP